MANFTGFLQADGYSGFQAMYHPARTKPGPIIEVACWAHCRRKIFDVWDATQSPIAKEALDRIAAIYVIEAKARFAPPAERVADGEDLDAFDQLAAIDAPPPGARGGAERAAVDHHRRRQSLIAAGQAPVQRKALPQSAPQPEP